MNRCCRWPLLVVVTLLCGCTSFDLNLADFRPGTEEDLTAQVHSIVCLWEAAEGVGLDGLPTRGFAGQILFFTRDRAEPVRVNGDVRVYVFDDQGSLEEQSRPLHQFDFPAEAWNVFLHKTNVGPSYQLFIPYTRKGGAFAECALRVRLSSEGRMPVYSKMATVTLPGRRTTAAKTSGEARSRSESRAIDATLPAGVTQQAALQRLAAEWTEADREARLQQLRRAAQGAIQTADYVEETDGAPNGPAGSPLSESGVESRRYRMSAPRAAIDPPVQATGSSAPGNFQ